MCNSVKKDKLEGIKKKYNDETKEKQTAQVLVHNLEIELEKVRGELSAQEQARKHLQETLDQELEVIQF